MLQSEERRKKAQEDIKASWEDGDLVGLFRAGWDNFLNMLGGNEPMPFQRFLDYTGSYFDKYIQKTSRREHLNYMGGKMFLQVNEDPNAAPVTIQLSADFYFQTQDKQWIVKKKSGKVDSSRFIDWETDASAAQLRSSGKLQFSIDPPEGEGK